MPRQQSVLDVLEEAGLLSHRSIPEFKQTKLEPAGRIYDNCAGLSPALLRKALSYDPTSGRLQWVGQYGTGGGGAARGTVVDRSSMLIKGFRRNTFGVIYLIMLGRLPETKVPFRDGCGMHWHWDNIKPLNPGEPSAFTLQNPRSRRDK